jgi:hypothetical protein
MYSVNILKLRNNVQIEALLKMYLSDVYFYVTNATGSLKLQTSHSFKGSVF